MSRLTEIPDLLEFHSHPPVISVGVNQMLGDKSINFAEIGEAQLLAKMVAETLGC